MSGILKEQREPVLPSNIRHRRASGRVKWLIGAFGLLSVEVAMSRCSSDVALLDGSSRDAAHWVGNTHPHTAVSQPTAVFRR